jgi:hypothetical protein
VLPAKSFRQLPQGRPAIGFSLVTDLEIAPGRCVRASERRDGELIGELTIEVFAAALIIDRDGILQAKASRATSSHAVPFTLDGISGYRGEALDHARALRYRQVLAIADVAAIDGGLLVTIRSAQLEWPAADELLRSLRLLTRGGRPAND